MLLPTEKAYTHLRTYSEKVYEALKQLHSFGYVHGDVRLPNVCFNENFDAVLIDLERCTYAYDCVCK